MEDNDTEKQALEPNQIEAEQIKNSQEPVHQKSNGTNSPLLNTQNTLADKWSKNPDTIDARFKRIGIGALVLALGGVALGLTNHTAVSSTSVSSGANILGILSYLGHSCLGIAALAGIIAVCVGIEFTIRRKEKPALTFWSGLATVLIVILYFVVEKLFLSS